MRPIFALSNLLVRATLRSTLARLAGRALATNRPLALVALFMLATLPALLFGLVADPRTITGAPAWLKPAKFAVSIAVYALTLNLLLGRIAGHRRAVRVISTTTSVALGLELILISVQVMRGTTSHFNSATPFDAALFNAM